MRWELRGQGAGKNPAQVQAPQIQILTRELARALAESRDSALAPFVSAHGDSRDNLISTVARLLVTRGVTDADSAIRFLSPQISHLHSPERMTGLRAAVERIEAAIERKEQILIYGDYDVDGTMAVIILKTAIELCGGSADFHVPHRIREGYDLRDDVIERAAVAGIRLIISVDMGIRAFAPAETAQRLGVDLIVTDHHLPGPDGVPRALAVVNPNQAGCEYPCKQLCGAGVAFKLAQGLLARRLDPKDQTRMLRSFMKVVAIATVADAVPLTGENRVFASLGLEALRKAVNPGLKALLEIAQVSTKRPPTSAEVAFRIAPRINAAGRMDVARDVIELFSVKDAERAKELAAKLDRLNTDRQEEERRILKAVDDRFNGEPSLCDAYCIVVDGDGWHRGVIGITATRVVERYNRPAVVISREEKEAFGSGRSIRTFHLLEAIESCRELFSRFGGHAHACGFSLPLENIPELRSRLDAFARNRLTLEDFDPVLDVDSELRLGEITPALFHALKLLEPYGVGNPEPVFIARGVRLVAPPKILKDKHVKLKLTPGADLSATSGEAEGKSNASRWRKALTFDALGWGMAERLQQAPLLAGDSVDIAFTLDHNDHPDYGGLEFSLRDLVVRSDTPGPSRRDLLNPDLERPDLRK